MFIEAPELSSHSGVRHAFFTRRGGVSEGVYASLNGGLGSSDDPARVRENRRRMAAQLGFPAEALVSVHQVHSPEAIVVEEPLAGAAPARRRHGDAAPGSGARRSRPPIAARSCSPIPRPASSAPATPAGAARSPASSRRRFAAMESLGARRERIVAVLGPTIGPNAYEVGPEFVGEFLAPDAGERALLPATSARAGHAMFDLPGLSARGSRRPASAKSPISASAPIRTRSDFFSYRRATHRGETGLRPPDLGDRPHAVSAIAPPLEPAPKARAGVPAADAARGCGRRRVPRN